MDEPKSNDDIESIAPTIRVLLVDNDPHHAEAMSESLERVGYQCVVATSGPAGVERIGSDTFDIVVTDLMMERVDGMDVLARARKVLPECKVIMVTGHASIPRAVEAVQQGAFNFLEKPLTPNRLRATVEKAAESISLQRRNVELNKRLDERYGFEGIIHTSSSMKRVIDLLKRLAPTDAGVLIRGESGTGKEVVAQAIHQNSPRKKKPFVAINCGAFAEHLVESELFGHVKGAFTDALTDRIGKFGYANGGTLFLDEVGDMPISTQIKLLRVLEEREITRVGDNKPIKVNVRVISATNRDLEEAIKNGTFRHDLYFRLKIMSVDLPNLADRREDIVPLIDSFRRRFAKQFQKTIKSVSPEVTRRLFEFPWPGNVRELLNVIQSMVVIDTDEILDIDDLPPDMQLEGDVASPNIEVGPSALVGKPLSDIERWAISETLKITNGNREETARILGIGARTLYRKLEKYDL
ncbi:MAG: two-component system response regulator HydG [Pirellulaceae bacterium]|jgi:two-component system response regulator HydG